MSDDPRHDPRVRGNVLPVQYQDPHPPWVRQLAFVCWVACDRSVRRAHQELIARWPEEDETPRYPSYATVAAWARREDWHYLADAVITDTFPGLRSRQVAMLTHGAIAGIQFLNDVIAGEYTGESQQSVKNRIEAAKIALMAGGAGAFGTRDNVVSAPKVQAATDIDYDALSSQEINALVRTLVHRTNTPDPRRG